MMNLSGKENFLELIENRIKTNFILNYEKNVIIKIKLFRLNIFSILLLYFY